MWTNIWLQILYGAALERIYPNNSVSRLVRSVSLIRSTIRVSQLLSESKVSHLVTVSQSVCQLVRQLVSKSVN